METNTSIREIVNMGVGNKLDTTVTLEKRDFKSKGEKMNLKAGEKQNQVPRFEQSSKIILRRRGRQNELKEIFHLQRNCGFLLNYEN